MNNEKPRLWTRNFVLIIVINFLVFMNHIMLLSTWSRQDLCANLFAGSG